MASRFFVLFMFPSNKFVTTRNAFAPPGPSVTRFPVIIARMHFSDFLLSFDFCSGPPCFGSTSSDERLFFSE